MTPTKPFVFGHGCFYDSLANLLISLGDDLTANRVVENSGGLHQYFFGKNLCMGTQTKAVRSLTRGAYTAKSTMLPFNQENIEQMRLMYGSRASEIQQIIEEEFRLGNLVVPNDKDCTYAPRLVFFDRKIIKKEDCTVERALGGGHVILQLDDDTFIDNGRIKNYDLAEFVITALMSVRIR